MNAAMPHRRDNMGTQITINFPAPDTKNWRTTVFGMVSAAVYAGGSYYINGGVSWKEALACAAWAVKCYLSADAAATTETEAQG